MNSYKADGCKRCGKHLDHHGNREERLAEEFALLGIGVAYRMKRRALDDEEQERYADLDITFVACSELLEKNEERGRA